MPLLWESPVFVKLHEGCGGRVRWVKAVDTMGVGYTGECIHCGAEDIPQEGIVPIRVRGEVPGFGGEFDIRDDVLDLDRKTRRDLRWEDDASHDENQRRLRGVVAAGGEA